MLRLARLRAGLPALLLGLGVSPSWAQTQGTAPAPLIVDGTVELIEWDSDYPQLTARHVAKIAGTSVTYSGHAQSGPQSATYRFTGTTDGFTIVGRIVSKVSYAIPECRSSGEYRMTLRTVLAPDGTLVLHGTNHESVLFSLSGPCAEGPNGLAQLGKTFAHADTSWIGTWRQLTVGADPTAVAEPGAGGKSSVRVEGNKIYLTDASGKESVVTLLPATKGAPPTFSATTAGDLGDAVQRYIVTHMWEASYAHLPADQRASFVTGIPMPGELAGETAESAVNWVKDNPAEVGLIVLSTAISVAFPLSAFANPAVATGGAAVLRSVVGTAMVAGTTGFVQSLFKTFLTTQSTGQRVGGAITKGVGDAVATVPGSLTGAGFDIVAGPFLAKAAVTAGSVAVGIATDKVTEKLQVSEKTAALVMKAPSYASSLLTLPNPSYEPGGISLTFDR